FAAARKYSAEVLVERYVAGHHHRLLVVGDQVVAATLREVPQVVGDGVRTIAELVEQINADPRRDDDGRHPMWKVHLDDPAALTVLAEQGYSPASIPPAGQRVLLRRNALLRDGGTI